MWESVEEFERVANRKKAAYILSNKCWFRLSCAMAALTVFLFIKALVSMFGAVRLDELQCVYDLAGYGRLETGLKKFGAMLGDYVEVGCNSVCNPGTVIGRNSNVYPTSCVRGVVPAGSIYKNNGDIVAKHE